MLQTSKPLHLGFLTVVQEASGFLGGYLVTNGWGRPLEFRLTTAVQPNRVQQILYGPTLTGFLHGELIGKTLVEKSNSPVAMIVTDRPTVLELRRAVSVPVLCIPSDESDADPGRRPFRAADASAPSWVIHPRHPEDETALREILAQLDDGFDLLEPFGRIREAIAEARKQGVTTRG